MVSKGLIFSGSCLPLASGPSKEQAAWFVVEELAETGAERTLAIS